MEQKKRSTYQQAERDLGQRLKPVSKVKGRVEAKVNTGLRTSVRDVTKEGVNKKTKLSAKVNICVLLLN